MMCIYIHLIFKMMNDNELLQVSDLIWNKLNSIENQNKDKKEQIEMIKGVIMVIAQEQRRVGKNQTLNYLQDEIINLRD